jgi:tRNA-splicing ligase RtcB
MRKSTNFSGPLERIAPEAWRIPKRYKPGMRVDGIIYASERLLGGILADQAPEQVANVAFLPGIRKASLAMPDIHWGYGFCIGGVCATDPADGGVISPGGVGYDINCGVRLLRSDLRAKDLDPATRRRLVDELFRHVPTGVGRTGPYRFSDRELDDIMTEGPGWLVRKRGLGCARDIEYTEAHGRLEGGEPEKVSDRAHARGASQCGTLGSGNHFLEVQLVDRVFDEAAAATLGIEEGGVCVLIHSGSRGLGYQVCDDYLRRFRNVPERYGIRLPDRQLACAPIESPEGRDYLGAMRAAANFAWSNRHLLTVQTREVFETVFGSTWEKLGLHLVYDVAHNIAKMETHDVDGEQREVCVHRKGATRAFPPGHPELPRAYRELGQPVLIPGSMGTASWLLLGQAGSMERTFGSSCHGAGRRMSRKGAIRDSAGRDIARELEGQGIFARARGRRELAEEQPAAYKDVDDVVDVVHRAGISRKVARMRSIGVIKG